MWNFGIQMQPAHFGLARQCAVEVLTVLGSCTHCKVSLSALRRWKKFCLEMLLDHTSRHGMTQAKMPQPRLIWRARPLMSFLVVQFSLVTVCTRCILLEDCHHGPQVLSICSW